jgi:hypothetical protein
MSRLSGFAENHALAVLLLAEVALIGFLGRRSRGRRGEE